MSSFTLLDWFVLVVYGVGILVVDWVYSRKTESQEDYLLAAEISHVSKGKLNVD